MSSRLGEFANIYELLDESDSSGVETGKKAKEAVEQKKAAAAAALAPPVAAKPANTQGQKPAETEEAPELTVLPVDLAPKVTVPLAKKASAVLAPRVSVVPVRRVTALPVPRENAVPVKRETDPVAPELREERTPSLSPDRPLLEESPELTCPETRQEDQDPTEDTKEETMVTKTPDPANASTTVAPEPEEEKRPPREVLEPVTGVLTRLRLTL